MRLAVDDGGNRLAAIAADGTVTLYALGGAGGGGGEPLRAVPLGTIEGGGWGGGVDVAFRPRVGGGGVLAVLWASGVLSFVQLVYGV